MTKLNELTIAYARDALVKGDLSAVELTTSCIEAMDGAQDLNAFITETQELSLERAAQSDARIANKESRGSLEGIPIAVKDLYCTEGVLTTAASHILDGFVPPYESTVTENLRNAGSVMTGKTNLDEFAMGSANVTSHYGPVKNPWKLDDGKDRVPGGSSGGSAAAVAAHLSLGAIGTDTGGSIRQPASFCGIVGMKPTYGRCSRWGTVAFASSLDQAGPMTKTVRDAAIVLQGMAGHDVKDSTSVPMAVPDLLEPSNVYGTMTLLPLLKCAQRLVGVDTEEDKKKLANTLMSAMSASPMLDFDTSCKFLFVAFFWYA